MTTALTHPLAQSAAAEHWQRIGIHQHHGINLPLFSLWSKNSCGIGEFLDLIPLIDWCAEIEFDLIQLLPLNDGADSSPYNAISSCALQPLHLSLTSLPGWDSDPELVKLVDRLQSLNTKPRIDWPTVRTHKEAFLRRYKELHFNGVAKSTNYQTFLSENPWLLPFAEFKALKSRFKRAPWREWPEDREAANDSEIEEHCFIQYLCFQQMGKVRAYAQKKGLFLKGDIPILVSSDSADAWSQPELFDSNFSAGAPPDQYSEEGQDWGFSPFNWERIESTDYAWWKQRLRVAGHLYHLYRVDHIVGLFRLWSIPRGKPAAEGFFIPEDPSTWIHHGSKCLEMMLKSTTMLPIGEDLGNVPNDVRYRLRELGICGTKVMRWERYWEGDQSFIPEADYIPESMTTVSTHDSETLSQWWTELPQEAQPFAAQNGWQYGPNLTEVERFEILLRSHRSGSLFHINLLQEYLNLQEEYCWPSPDDERINVPGKILDSNWSYRFRAPLETFTSDSTLNRLMKCLRGPFSSSL